MSKIYLSLDDLQKLYGISPAVVKAIKKKRRKRRNKKAKLNNGTMGNKPSSSEHMAGYASATAIAAGQLQQSNINRHIADINQSNEKLRLTNDTTIIQPLIKPIYQEIIDGIESGKLKLKQKGNAVSIINKDLDKKPGPKPRNYEILSTPTKNKIKLSNRSDNIGAASQPDGFMYAAAPYQSLASSGSNKFDRYAASATDFDDGFGNMAAGTSSDSFAIDMANDLLGEIVDEGVEATAAGVFNEEAASANISQRLDEPLATSSAAAEPDIPKAKTIDDYEEIELDNILALNNYRPKKFKSKISKFNKLNNNNLL